jgi:hypothetical protein
MQHMLQHQHKHHVTTICQHTQRPALQGTSMHVKVIVKKKPSKNIFFAKYRHIMFFLQKILFPKKSVTDRRGLLLYSIEENESTTYAQKWGERGSRGPRPALPVLEYIFAGQNSVRTTYT